ncbi:MAG: substrate-binding domain-containing protein [Opitutales bacterium]|nr:substrate-binding domain-containing protein [Opitutales bacterium]
MPLANPPASRRPKRQTVTRVAAATLPVDSSHFLRITEGAAAWFRNRPGWMFDVAGSAKFVERVDGYIVACFKPDGQRPGRAAPAVNVSNVLPLATMPSVVSDDREAGRCAARFLLGQEHPDYALFAPLDNEYTRLRAEGFRAELARTGHTPLTLGEPGLLDSMDRGQADKNTELLRARLARLPRPCAIFATDDLRCALLCRIILGAGYRVPEDFALLGVDDNRFLCENTPVPLSSVALGSREIGRRAAALLARCIEHGPSTDSAPSRVTVPPEGVVERASTNVAAADDRVVARARAIIEAGFREPLKIEALAERIGVSRRYLEMRFKSVLAESPQQTLLRRRLREARKRLTTSDESIADVAYACGFSDYKQMALHIRKEWGVSAREIRASRTDSFRG